MAEQIDYEGLLTRAQSELAWAKGEEERLQREWDAEQRKWAHDIDEAKGVVANAEQGVRAAERAPHVDALNGIRRRALPLGDKWDSGLDNLKVQRALDALWQEGQQAAKALNNGQPHWAYPFVPTHKARERFNNIPARQPKSATHALGLVDEKGKVVFVE